MVPYISAGACDVEGNIQQMMSATTFLPWFCLVQSISGDVKQPYYRLHDALFILSKTENVSFTAEATDRFDYHDVD